MSDILFVYIYMWDLISVSYVPYYDHVYPILDLNIVFIDNCSRMVDLTMNKYLLTYKL